MAQSTTEAGTGTKHSARIERLYARLWEGMLSKKPWWGERLTVLDDPEVAASPLIVRKAKAIEKVLAEMPVRTAEGELIVGVMPMGSMGTGNVFPEYAKEEEIAAATEKSLSVFSVYGHSVPDYASLLRHGLGGLRNGAEAKLHALSDADPAAARQGAFLQAAAISCNAVIQLAHRYSELATRLAKDEVDPQHREELLRIAEICTRVPENPARSFREALQSVWFIYVALQGTLSTVPLGRFDYYTYPYLKADLESGAISLDQVQELVDCFWIKLNERTQYLQEHREYHPDPYKLNIGIDPNDGPVHLDELDTAYDNHWLQHVALSGQTPDGQDSTNEVTYCCLEAASHFELTQPTVSVRLSPQAPEGLLQKCCEVIRGGGGMPALFNDRVIVEALNSFGFPLEEARGYSPDGCWEPLIPGKTDFCWGPVHGLKALEMTLTRGLGRVDGLREGPDTGDPRSFESFDRLLQAYKIQLDHQVEGAVANFAAMWRATYEIAPEPLLSCLIEGCLEQGKELTEGGARYIYYPLYLSGLAHTADSLAVIKKLVYEQHGMTMDQLLGALESNFDGLEVVRQLLLTRAPKFGNGIDYVDDLAREVAVYFAGRVKEHGSRHPQFLFPWGIGAIGGLYLPFGKLVGATPDGRHALEAISPGGTPAPGRDLAGPTAAVRSYTRLGFAEIPGAGPLDLGMESNAIRGEQGLRRMIAFVRGFLELGGSILTLTVTDVETLRKAQVEPEKYRGLRVRMGGWQAYFVNLNREHQEHHIARVKHTIG